MFVFIFLRAKLTALNWNESVTNSTNIPIFTLCFVAWCGHCRRAFPEWQEFQAEFESNPSMLIGSVNCSEEEHLCRTVLNVSSYPTYITIMDAKIRRVSPNRSLAGYRQTVSRLAQLQNGSFFTNITGDPPSFPAIVFKLHPNDEVSRQIAVECAYQSNLLDSHVFCFEFSENRTEPDLSAVLERSVKVDLDTNFTVKHINRFLNEHSHTILGSWSMSSIRLVHRLFAVVFAESHAEIDQFRGVAISHQDVFGWGSTILRGNADHWTRFFKIPPSSLPVLTVIDVHNSRYHKLVNATSLTAVEAYLAQFENDETEIEFEAFERPKRNSLMKARGFWREVLNGFLLVIGPVVLVVAIVVGIVAASVFLYLHYRDRKRAAKDD
jgi:thiol-disulfide isomerase/thioredoxin